MINNIEEIEAIFWDCDGVLIDSEWIACGLAAKVLCDAGYHITTNDFVRRFAGQSKKHVHDTIASEAGFDVWSKIDNEAKHIEQRRLFTEQLTAISGVEDILKATIPMAVASGSDYDRLRFTLNLVNMTERFGPHIYSSVDVPRGKPAPDIFLYAAQKLGIDNLEKCLVIEDSHNGVRAGKAANMTVFGFTGGTHVIDKQAHAAELTALGADWVFHDMRELKERLQPIMS